MSSESDESQAFQQGSDPPWPPRSLKIFLVIAIAIPLLIWTFMFVAYLVSEYQYNEQQQNRINSAKESGIEASGSLIVDPNPCSG